MLSADLYLFIFNSVWQLNDCMECVILHLKHYIINPNFLHIKKYNLTTRNKVKQNKQQLNSRITYNL